MCLHLWYNCRKANSWQLIAVSHTKNIYFEPKERMHTGY